MAGGSRRESRARSPGWVILTFSGEPSTTCAAMPIRAVMEASSVAVNPSPRAASWAASRVSRAKPWGVCTAASSSRGRVSRARPSGETRVMVSVTATPGTTAEWPDRRAWTTRPTSDGSTKGRAASWTRTWRHSAGRTDSPARTESWRRAPPAEVTSGSPRSSASAHCRVRAVASSRRSAGKTSVSPARAGLAARALAACQKRGRPAKVRNCLGAPCPAAASREPLPAATITAQTFGWGVLDMLGFLSGGPAVASWGHADRMRRGTAGVSRGKKRESDDKPGSVPRETRGGRHSSRTGIAPGLKQPTRGHRPGQPQSPPYLVLLRTGFAEPVASPRPLVGSCPTVSPLPARTKPRGRSVFCGTFQGSLPLGVTQRSALRSPDFPPRTHASAATACPTPTSENNADVRPGQRQSGRTSRKPPDGGAASPRHGAAVSRGLRFFLKKPPAVRPRNAWGRLSRRVL
ncbi:hypothetical protein ASZ90_002946 [hydrocarbon metagenome]|uniref:Uncharacterized protein n=1 Tax=hydrocarbon metagenome TaxID=938273 RepID=A0A0W8G1Z6_9ZZZZ